jgi:hypothetical protein
LPCKQSQTDHLLFVLVSTKTVVMCPACNDSGTEIEMYVVICFTHISIFDIVFVLMFLFIDLETVEGF